MAHFSHIRLLYIGNKFNLLEANQNPFHEVALKFSLSIKLAKILLEVINQGRQDPMTVNVLAGIDRL